MSKKRKPKYKPVSSKKIWFKYDKTYSKDEEEEYQRILAENQTPSPEYDTYYDFPLDFKSSFPNTLDTNYKDNTNTNYPQQKSQTSIYRIWYLNKKKISILIQGYIKSICLSYKAFRFGDVIGCIVAYFDENLYHWRITADKLIRWQNHLADPDNNPRYRTIINTANNKDESVIVSHPKTWDFQFALNISSKPKHVCNQSFGENYSNSWRQSQQKGEYIWMNLRWTTAIGSNITTNRHRDYEKYKTQWECMKYNYCPAWMKIYYELRCVELEQIKLFKGVLKYNNFVLKNRGANFRQTRPHLLFPVNYLKIEDFAYRKEINLRLSVRFLCSQWYSGNSDHFEKIILKKYVSFRWYINKRQFEKYFDGKLKDIIIFSDNFDDDNWCLYFRYNENAMNRKKTKFYIGLMCIKLPWNVNYVRAHIAIKCNDKNKKQYLKQIKNARIWTGFGSAIQIPFSKQILKESNSLKFTVKIKICKAYDSNDKE
eukprot:42997_1